jgi:hypothetical protein
MTGPQLVIVALGTKHAGTRELELECPGGIHLWQ